MKPLNAAEEIAVKIVSMVVEKVDREGCLDAYSGIELSRQIAKALTAYAEARIKETPACRLCIEDTIKVRNEALEEAAKLSEEFVMSDGDHGTEIAKAIRARKSKLRGT